MKTTDMFKQIKKEYHGIAPRQEFSKNGWEELKILLDPQDTKPMFYQLFAFRFVTSVLLFLCIGSGTVLAASFKAIPGDTLYPVKKFSEQVVLRVMLNETFPIENRVREVQEAAKRENKDSLQETVGNYTDALKESEGKQSSRSAQKKTDFNNTLNRHEQQLQEVQESVPSSKHEVDKAVQAIEEAKEKIIKETKSEVKGEEEKNANEHMEEKVKDALQDGPLKRSVGY